MSQSAPPRQMARKLQPVATSTTRRRILLVEDHFIVSQGLADLINYEKDLEVCGVAHDSASALQKVELLKPELVVLDISLGAGNGLDLLKQLKLSDPELRVLVFSMHDESLYAARALRAGAAGYLMKQETTDTVLTAIRQIFERGTFVSERMEKQLRQRFAHSRRAGRVMDPVETLSPRELEVFQLIGEGKGTSQIAQQLGVSPKTVETHRSHVKEKLGLRSGSELIRYAIEIKRAA